MSLDANTREELQAMLHLLCEGLATSKTLARLESLIVTNPAACEYYVRYMQLHGALQLSAMPLGTMSNLPIDTRDDHLPRAVTKRAQPVAMPRSPVLGFLDRRTHMGGEFRLNSIHVIAGLAGLFLILSLMAIVPAYLGLRRAELENAQREQREEQERQLAASQAQERELAKKLAASKPKPPPLLDVYAKLLSERNPLYTARAVRDSVTWVYANGLAQARMSFAVDCRWRGAAPDVGEALTRGRRLELKAGLAEIVFQNGARTILQGPATLQIDSGSGAYLKIGRYTVNVEDPRAKGFEVNTPGMKYTDLGTEFGVVVDADGEQQMHVFRGKVQADVAATERVGDGKSGRHEDASISPSPHHPLAPSPPPRPLVVSAHQAIRVAAPAEQGKPPTPIESIPMDETQFVRTIPPLEIDLADVVAGGDGFSGRAGRGINQLTGEVATVKGTLLSMTRTTRLYCKVAASKFIDGVFIPEGGAGPVQLDSAGHLYALPKTSGHTDHSIFAENVGPLANRDGAITTALAARVIVPHPQLYLHANVGITFDLDALRAGRAGYRPARFQAVLCAERTQTRSAVMAAWVFVDGELCFSKPKLRVADGSLGIDIPLSNNAKFLTLVATDADLDINSDHVIFHSPRVVMAAATPSQ